MGRDKRFQMAALPDAILWRERANQLADAKTKAYKVKTSYGDEHYVKRKDQFEGPDGQIYQVCSYRGELRLWPVNARETFPLSEIGKRKLRLLDNILDDLIYSERFIHERLYNQPLKSYTGVELDENTKKEYEEKIMKKLAQAKKDKLVKASKYKYWNEGEES